MQFFVESNNIRGGREVGYNGVQPLLRQGYCYSIPARALSLQSLPDKLQQGRAATCYYCYYTRKLFLLLRNSSLCLD